jgi:LysM repeat protein
MHATLIAEVTRATVTGSREYRVIGGDTLSEISRKEYGTGGCWRGIWTANSSSISDPNLIYVGQELTIPGECDRGDGGGVRTVSKVTPVPAPAPAPAPSSGSGGFYDDVLSYGQIEELWDDAGGPGWAAAESASIAECESGGNRFAYNPSGATGIWQILGQVTDFGRSLDDPWVNAANAVSKFRASGDTFAQWVC